MKIDLTGGELGTMRALVFVALTDARSALVMAHIRVGKSADVESVRLYDQQSEQVGHLEALLEKLEFSNAQG